MYFLASVLLVGCTKSEEKKDADTPRSAAPDEIVGNWMYGNFSMTEFWSFNGAYQGNAFQLSVAFKFFKDGTYERYTVAASNVIIGCRVDNFAFEKGTVNYDNATQSFTTHPSQAKFRRFSCTGNLEGEMPTRELKTNTYKWKTGTGSGNTKKLLLDPDNKGENYSEFYAKSW